jgi:flagellar motor switch protein FliN
MNATLTPTQTDTFKRLMLQFMEEGSTGMAAMMGANLKVLSIDPVLNASWADIPDRFEGEGPLWVEATLRGPLEQPLRFLLKCDQARLLADLLLKGEATVPSDSAITDVQVSGVGECINQLMSAGLQTWNATASKRMDLATTEARLETDATLSELETSYNTAFFTFHGQWQLAAGKALDETLDFVIFMTEAEALNLVSVLSPEQVSAPVVPASTQPVGSGESFGPVKEAVQQGGYVPSPALVGAGMSEAVYGADLNAGAGYAHGSGYAAASQPYGYPMPPGTVAQPVQFASFDVNHPVLSGTHQENMSLLMDINLNLHVELGRTNLSIKNILELTRGSVIELDKVAGEAVDLYANGKLIARGEVVVIEDNFGLRVSSIVSPAERLRGL